MKVLKHNEARAYHFAVNKGKAEGDVVGVYQNLDKKYICYACKDGKIYIEKEHNTYFDAKQHGKTIFKEYFDKKGEVQ